MRGQYEIFTDYKTCHLHFCIKVDVLKISSDTYKRIKEYYKDFRQHGKTEQLDTLYGMQRDVMQKITNTSRDGYTLTNADLFAMKKIIRKNLLVDTLDEETLQLFVSRIEIGHVEREPSGSYKRVKLYYRF